MPDATNLITAPQAAAIAGVHRATITRWAQAGKLRIVRKSPGLRGEYLFDASDVRALLSKAA